MMIRTASPDDAPAIGGLKVRAWRAAYSRFMSHAYLDALDPADETTDWAEYLAAMPDAHRLWVLSDAGDVVGFGTGLGRRLFTYAVADLEVRGHGPLCVYAYLPNEVAQHFYRRAGFAPDGRARVEDGDGPGVPEARFVKPFRP
ncbi:hypothetical protein ABZ016_29445 [Streptomyces sp. NPDC006372]|uniref:GNAT family N-acetyltransferase n=1 Tax=Streptomyces sp. NPDC006372 TaxID=3155599 RepID=UPI0033A3C5CA